jgi:hypothetical protein
MYTRFASGLNSAGAATAPASVLPILFLVGLYSPSSVGGSYSTVLWAAYFCLLATLLVVLMARKDGVLSVSVISNSVLIVAVLLVASILAPFPEYQWGGLLPFIGLALLFSVNLREFRAGENLRRLVTAANLINVLVGLAVILQNDSVGNFLVDHYSSGYPELVGYMMSEAKPVLTFGSHSTGAFFYYLFFFINFETFKVYKDWPSLAFALCYVVLGSYLRSFTALCLMSVAAFQLFRYATKNRLALALLVVVVAGVAAAGTLYYFVPDPEDRAAMAKVVSDVATNPSGGFMGRFTEAGTLYTTVLYIRDRPFTPVGIGFRSDLMFGDSGPVEYFLRGSVVLVAAIYGGLYVFLRRNLLSRYHFVLLFLVILAFETGFSSLCYLRTLYLLPVFVVYLNDLSRRSGADARLNVLAAPVSVE